MSIIWLGKNALFGATRRNWTRPKGPEERKTNTRSRPTDVPKRPTGYKPNERLSPFTITGRTADLCDRGGGIYT